MSSLSLLPTFALVAALVTLVGCSTTAVDSTAPAASTTTDSTAAKIIVELEDGEFFEAQAAADHDGFTGTGFADFMRWQGAWVKSTFTAASAGTYHMTLRFANGSFEPRPLRILVNDKVIMEKLIFPPTEDEIWDLYRTQTVYNVPLDAGTNTLTFISLEEDGPNLDSATFVKAE